MIVKVTVETENYAWALKKGVELLDPLGGERENLLDHVRTALINAGMALVEREQLPGNIVRKGEHVTPKPYKSSERG